ncbi:MAG: hypothetical protein QW641_01935 [Candidatus Aenigmatarchaeota archaeon]
MRAQLMPLFFVIFVIFSVIFIYIFFNIFYGTKYETQVFEISIVDRVRNVIENLKNFLHLSLTYSAHKALKEQAEEGGLRPAGSWICNAPSQPSIDEAKQCLEKWTQYYLNVYLNNFTISLPLDIIKKNFTSCIYDIDENGILSGVFDEGYFWVNCSYSPLIVKGINVNISAFENITTNDFITKNRFWYMFRIFYEWANDNVYGRCMCAACLACGGCDAAQRCAQEAYNDLIRRFDNDVKCKEPSRDCCDHESGPVSCEKKSECLTWTDTQCTCIGHFCTNPPWLITGYAMAQEEEKRCPGWAENRLAATYTYKCEDHKYYVPSINGPVPLKFNVKISAMYRCPDRCYVGDVCPC